MHFGWLNLSRWIRKNQGQILHIIWFFWGLTAQKKLHWRDTISLTSIVLVVIHAIMNHRVCSKDGNKSANQNICSGESGLHHWSKKLMLQLILIHIQLKNLINTHICHTKRRVHKTNIHYISKCSKNGKILLYKGFLMNGLPDYLLFENTFINNVNRYSTATISIV